MWMRKEDDAVPRSSLLKLYLCLPSMLCPKCLCQKPFSLKIKLVYSFFQCVSTSILGREKAIMVSKWKAATGCLHELSVSALKGNKRGYVLGEGGLSLHPCPLRPLADLFTGTQLQMASNNLCPLPQYCVSSLHWLRGLCRPHLWAEGTNSFFSLTQAFAPITPLKRRFPVAYVVQGSALGLVLSCQLYSFSGSMNLLTLSLALQPLLTFYYNPFLCPLLKYWHSSNFCLLPSSCLIFFLAISTILPGWPTEHMLRPSKYFSPAQSSSS